MEEMRQRIDRGDADREVTETIQVGISLWSLILKWRNIDTVTGYVRHCERPSAQAAVVRLFSFRSIP